MTNKSLFFGQRISPVITEYTKTLIVSVTSLTCDESTAGVD
jgi:hypothetical protein